MTIHSRDTAQTQTAIDTHRVALTFFDDKFASVAYRDALTLPELADEIRDMTDSSKTKLPWLKLATFGSKASRKNCLRTNDNLLVVTGVEVDYDAGDIPFDEAVKRLRSAGLRAIVYTSASYVKGVKEKWRVLAPLSEEKLPAAREGLVAVLNGVLGGGIDPASFTLSTAFYYGSVNSNPEHRVEVLDGSFLDLRADLLHGAIGRPPRAHNTGSPIPSGVPSGEAPGYSIEDIQRLLESSQRRNSDGSGRWHNVMTSVTASLVNRGWSNDAIFKLTEDYCNGGWGDTDLAELVDGARRKWGVPDPDIAAEAMGMIVAAAKADRGIVDDPDAIVEPMWREMYANGRPKPSLYNARIAIEAMGVECSVDTFHNRMFMGRGTAGGPLRSFHGAVTDVRVGALRVAMSDAFRLDFTEKHVNDAVVTLCHESAFNPVTDMLAEAEANWDGVARLDRMAVDHFNADDTELNRACVRKVMIAAVARARNPGCKFDTILVMESPEGWNKSSAWAVLAGEGNFSDQSILGQAGREVQEQLSGVWIHENAELAGMRKTEVEMIKAFASRQVDRARPAYGRHLVEQPRHSIEVATTNDHAYLLSTTGNRRFWPIAIRASIDLPRLRAARLQLWGEAAHYQSKGEILTLGEHLWAVAGVEQEARREAHPWEGPLANMTKVVPAAPGGDGYWGNGVVHIVDGEERVATSVIFDHVLKLPMLQLNIGHAKTVSAIMRQQGWTRGVFFLDGKTVKGYVRTKKP